MPHDERIETPELVEAARRAIDVLDHAGAPYAVIGGVAAARYGILRATRDIDLLLGADRRRLPALLDAFAAAGFDVDGPAVIREMAQDGMSQIRYGKTPIDLLAPILPAFVAILKRARREPILGRKPFVARPEDVVVLKALAMRGTDRLDIEGILMAQAGRLNLRLVRQGVDALLPAGDPRREELDILLRAYRQAP